MKIKIHQIHYDSETFSRVHPDFIPLDNANGPKDWYEFYPMLQTLRHLPLEDDTWYAFLSPKFFDKVRINHDELLAILEAHKDYEVGLFSPFWHMLALHFNTWDQGEIFHPGLKNMFDNFLSATNREKPLGPVVSDFKTSVFSNYIVAKKRFWLDWTNLAEDFLSYTERQKVVDGQDKPTKYKGEPKPLKVFVQERLCNYLLLNDQYKTFHLDYVKRYQMTFDKMESIRDRQRFAKALVSCDRSKRNYLNTGRSIHLLTYRVKRRRANLIRANKGYVSGVTAFLRRKIQGLMSKIG